MNTINRSFAGHWSDRPEVDHRVSRAEQEDRQIPIGATDKWEVIFLIAPVVLTLIGAASLVAALLRT